jgi:rod shape-determining protein MreD
MIPKHVWGFNHIVPLLPLMPIFYWARLQTGEMPFWFVAMIGILYDAVHSTPLGMSAILYLIFTALIHSQSKYIHKEAFVVMWGYFVSLLGMICAAQWLMMAMLNGKLYGFVPALLQVLITACLYPFFHKIFDAIHEHVKQRRWMLAHG